MGYFNLLAAVFCAVVATACFARGYALLGVANCLLMCANAIFAGVIISKRR